MQGKAEDDGGLAPTQDDNAAMRSPARRTCLFVCLDCYKNSRLPGVIIELKASKDCSDTALKQLSNAALQQIIDKKYTAEMKAKGIPVIYQYGVAFCGKNVEVVTNQE